MQSIKNLTIVIFGLISMTSCEDVIELDLESSEPQTILEATIDATAQTATVLLTESNSFYDQGVHTALSGASILLTDDTGLNYSLLETESGVYQMENIDLSTATDFSIVIDINGELYETSAEVPAPVALDSIIVSTGGGGPLAGDGNQRLQAIFQDTPNVENYYRIRAYQNDTLLASIYTVLDDQLRGDGEEINIGIRQFFEVDNTVTLELLSTSKGYYDYFFQLSSQSGRGGNSTTPFNPVGNFTNNGFGYFGIFHSSTRSVQL